MGYDILTTIWNLNGSTVFILVHSSEILHLITLTYGIPGNVIFFICHCPMFAGIAKTVQKFVKSGQFDPVQFF